MMVRILGAVLAIAGVITIILAVTVTTGSSWLSELLVGAEDAAEITDAQREFANDAKNAGLLFESFIYIFGIYMLIMGVMAVACCGAKCAGKKMCVCLFQIFQIILLVLTLVITLIPTGMRMISDEAVEGFCASTPEQIANEYAGDESYKAGLLVQGRQFIADADESVNLRSDLMCRNPCACQVENFDAWSTGENWSAPREWEGAGTVTNWADCQLAIATHNENESARN